MEVFFFYYFTLKSQRFDCQKSRFPAGRAASQRANSQTTSNAPVLSGDCQQAVPENLKCSDSISRSVCLCVCVCFDLHCRVQWQRQPAEQDSPPLYWTGMLSVNSSCSLRTPMSSGLPLLFEKWRKGQERQMTGRRGLTRSNMFTWSFYINEWDSVNLGWPFLFFLIAQLKTSTSIDVHY